MERIDTLKAFVAKERSTMKSFNDPKNIQGHKWYIKESLNNMKGEMLREIDSLLQDKRVTLMRQYNNHNDSLRKEISELENERKEIYNFKFNDGAIMKNAKVKSYLAQEFRDLKARLSKKTFNDQKSKWISGLATIKDALKNFKDVKQVVQYKGYTITVYVEKDQTVCNITKNGKDIGGFSSFSGMSMNEAIKAAKEEVDEDIKFGDSAIKDEIVRRVDYRGCHIYIGKQGDYTYSVYTKNSMSRPLAWDTGYGSESEALEAGKKSADLIVQKFGDSAEYINDRKIDIKRDGKLIDVVNAESLDEAVRIYERQHPELRGQIDAYFSDEAINDVKVVTKKEWDETPKDYKTIINGKKYMMYIDPQSHMTVLGPVEVKDAVIKDFISYDKDWAERMFKAGYSARETAMKIEAYSSSTNHSEQADLINRLEKHRKEWFERRLEEVRAGRK